MGTIFFKREDDYFLCVFFGHFEKSTEKFNHVQFHHNLRISGNRKSKTCIKAYIFRKTKHASRKNNNLKERVDTMKKKIMWKKIHYNPVSQCLFRTKTKKK